MLERKKWHQILKKNRWICESVTRARATTLFKIGSKDIETTLLLFAASIMPKWYLVGYIATFLCIWEVLRTKAFHCNSSPCRFSKQQAPTARTVVLCLSKEGNDADDETSLGSLDHVLEKARKRSSNLWFYRVRAFTNQPILSIPGQYGTTFTVLDVVYILIAPLIDAKGFAAGLFIGKLTAAFIREKLDPAASATIIIMLLWPVVLAIILDQFIS